MTKEREGGSKREKYVVSNLISYMCTYVTLIFIYTLQKLLYFWK